MHGESKLYGVRPRQVSRADTLWRKLFSIKGESPEPIPVVPVLGEPIEAQFINGWRNYEDSITSIGDATHPAQVFLGFGNVDYMIAVLTRLEVFYVPTTLGSPVKLGWSATLASNNTGKPRDLRLGAAALTGQLKNRSIVNAAAQYSVAVDVYPVGGVGAGASVHQVIVGLEDQIVITGTDSIEIASFANAETINVRYSWRERVLEPSERNQ